MNLIEETAGARRIAQSKDVLSVAEIFELLRHVVRFREQPPIADPLQHAVDQSSNNPSFAQSRLLKHILIALVAGAAFRRAETARQDAATQALVFDLLDLRRAGARSPEDWSAAIEAAEAASA